MQKDTLYSELQYKATRSSGPGGQHANKANTRVELYWSLEDSQGLSASEKKRLRLVFANRLNKDGVLILGSEKTRSQQQNKEVVTQHFFRLLEKALRPPKKRIRTQIPRSAQRKRLENKRKQAEKKALRKPPTR